jgi:hypothetical protein
VDKNKVANHRRQSQQSRLELGLRVNLGFERANNPDCRCHRGDRKRFVVRADEKLTRVSIAEAHGGDGAFRLQRQITSPWSLEFSNENAVLIV